MWKRDYKFDPIILFPKMFFRYELSESGRNLSWFSDTKRTFWQTTEEKNVCSWVPWIPAISSRKKSDGNKCEKGSIAKKFVRVASSAVADVASTRVW